MESLIESAIQGHASTRDAMRWLVRQLVPATQPAEVTGLLEAFDDAVSQELLSVSHVEYDSHEICKHFASKVRAILALRPGRVPMTDEQVDSFMVDGRLHWLGKRQLIRAVEAHHGITAQAKKEGE